MDYKQYRKQQIQKQLKEINKDKREQRAREQVRTMLQGLREGSEQDMDNFAEELGKALLGDKKELTEEE